MPRTFSRGIKFTAEDLERFTGFLVDAEAEEFARRMRLLFCPEAPLIEQDLFDFFDFLFNGLRRLDDLIASLSGGGIVPGSMKTITSEIEEETVRIRALFRRAIV